jgi:hypothetical protein
LARLQGYPQHAADPKRIGFFAMRLERDSRLPVLRSDFGTAIEPIDEFAF